MWILRERQDPQDLGTDLKWEEAEDVGKVTRFLVRAAGGEPLNPGVGGAKEASGRLCAPWGSPARPVLGMKYQSAALAVNTCGRG